jgi:hypothetical protein
VLLGGEQRLNHRRMPRNGRLNLAGGPRLNNPHFGPNHGVGSHMRLGVNFAKLAMQALFGVKRFHIEKKERLLHNVLRGFGTLIVTLE